MNQMKIMGWTILTLAIVVAAHAGAATIGGVTFDPESPPAGIVLREDLNLYAAQPLDGQVIHDAPLTWVPRAIKTPGGDYLMMFPSGRGMEYQGDVMLSYRSSDKGKTWDGPTVAFAHSQSHHAFIPFIPKGSTRIYAFGTQGIPGMVGKGPAFENAPIGYRYSDDDGKTWSHVTLIEPTNDPAFIGMSALRMCETDAGTWLLGTHVARWTTSEGSLMKRLPIKTWQYVLRSEDQGKTWQLLPGPRPDGWQLPKFNRMEEGTLVNIGGGEVLLLTRTAEGHLWNLRSVDDGKTWSEPAPTPLVHPDAPAMMFKLSDDKTILAFIHNQYNPEKPEFDGAARNEVWVVTSSDGGRTWSEPRFLLAGMSAKGHVLGCSYLDMFTDEGKLHIFLSQKRELLLYLTIDEDKLDQLQTKAQLETSSKQ